VTPILVVVTGARRIEGSPHEVEARTWLTARLLVIGPDVLVYGDATGPDAWAHDYATKRRVPWFRYTKRGTIERHDGAPVRWTDQPPPAHGDNRALWGAWLLHRDRIMVQHAAKRADRYDVRLVGLMASTPGTGGTIATINRADALGIPCETEVF
jgi:hypothetical protein